MKPNEKAYWAFKFCQLFATFLCAITLYFLVGLPYFTIDLRDGLLLLTIFSASSWLSNGVNKKMIKEDKNEKN